MKTARHGWEKRAEAYFGSGLIACIGMGVLTAWAEPAAGHLLHGAGLLLASLWLCVSSMSVIPFQFSWLLGLLLMPVAMAVAQLATAQTTSSFETLNSAAEWLARAGVFGIAISTFRSERRRQLLGDAASWFGAGIATLALLQWYTGSGKILWSITTGEASEVAATFLNRDHYSVLIEMLLPFAVVRTVSGSRPLLYAVCAGLMFSSVVACASRAGTVIVVVEVIVLLVMTSRGEAKAYQRGALLIASLLLFAALGGWQVVWERFQLQDPFAYRREMLLATINMIQAKPLTGHGLGTWPSVYPQFALFDPPGIYMNHAHNDWAEWAAEGGIALSIMLGIFGAGLAWSVRRIPWALGLIAVCLHAGVDFPFQKAALALTFFALAGIAYAASMESKASCQTK